MRCQHGTREGRTKNKAGYPALMFHGRLQPARMTGLIAACTMCARAGYKFKEVVRKRAEREDLVGVECPDCRRFYAACQTWSIVPPGAAPQCGHALQGDHCRLVCAYDKRHKSTASRVSLTVAR